MSPILLVTIDTEEEFDWDAPVSPQNTSVEHIEHLPRLQQLFEDVGVRPTYVVDYPIATTPLAVDVLGDIYRRNQCEIGAHLHPWVNPPIEEAIEPRNSFLSNLPLELQIEKLRRLTCAIEDSFGHRPTTFKAGRYGIDFALVPELKRLGYTVDTSVIAYTDFSAEEGPNFSELGNDPFWLNPPLVPGREEPEPLLEIPCTVGFTRRPMDRWANVHRSLATSKLRKMRPIGFLWHLRILRKIVLTPEGTDIGDQIKLLQVMAHDSDAILNVTLHSPSVAPGHTPYVRNEEQLELFFTRLRKTLEYAISDLGAESLTFSEFYSRYHQLKPYHSASSRETT